LFTLALGAVVAHWVVGGAPWRLHVICGIALSAVFLEEAIDFDLIGIVLPAVFVSAMRGVQFAKGWTWIMLVFLNLDAGHVVGLEEGHFVLREFSLDPIMILAGTIVLPWVSYMLCRRIPGDRYLPRYALYWFYPGHLLLFVIWRLVQGDLPLDLFAF